MPITYSHEPINNKETSVPVTFTDDDGKVYTRSINVPYKNGLLDKDEWEQRLEDHLRSVIHKSQLGVVTFVEPADTNN